MEQKLGMARDFRGKAETTGVGFPGNSRGVFCFRSQEFPETLQLVQMPREEMGILRNSRGFPSPGIHMPGNSQPGWPVHTFGFSPLSARGLEICVILFI